MSRDEPKPTGGGLEPIATLGTTAPISPSAAARPPTPFVRKGAPGEGVPSGIARPEAVRIHEPASGFVQLLWLDDGLGARLRSPRAWRALAEAIEEEADTDLELALQGQGNVEELRTAFEILARATPTGAEGVAACFQEAVRGDGKFVPPLVLVRGSMALPFDPAARLETSFALVAPLAASQPQLRDVVEGARPFLERPEALPGGAEGLARQLLAATKALRSLPEGQLDRAVERLLLERRSYQRRDVFGAPHVRATMSGSSAAEPALVAYLSEAASKTLPLASEIAVRVLAEVHTRVDDAESQGYALRVRCLAREVSIAKA
jgi:hypothetical protein